MSTIGLLCAACAWASNMNMPLLGALLAGIAGCGPAFGALGAGAAAAGGAGSAASGGGSGAGPRVNDERAAQFIRIALHNVDRNYQMNPASRDLEAWRELKAMRDAERGPADVDLAAAEHYLFARFASRFIGTGLMDLAALGYYGVKASGISPHWGSGPASPPSTDQLLWGMQGAADGPPVIPHPSIKHP